MTKVLTNAALLRSIQHIPQTTFKTPIPAIADYKKKFKSVNHMLYRNNINLDFHVEKECFTSVNKSPLKIIKNAFYFILKAFFILKCLSFCLEFLVM